MHPIIVWGTRTRSKPLGQLTYVCPRCQQNCPHVVAKKQYIFTLFFIPLFPVGSSYLASCVNCRLQEKVAKEQAKKLFPTS
jgi:hypothetical protein